MRSIVIMGAGELGGALTRALAASDIASTITLVDEAGQVAEGKALDIRQAAPLDGYVTAVFGTSDESVVIAADAIVVADRFATRGNDRQDDASLGLVRRLARLNQRAMILCADALQMDVIERGVREIGIPHHRLLGSAPEALHSAIVSMTALEAGCTPLDICLTVVGRPPGQIIVPWDDASIAGMRATAVLTPPALSRLDARLPRLWPPGPLTLAAAAERIITAAATRGRSVISAFVAVTREAGERDRVGMLPITVNASGVATILAPSLTTRDRVRLETALQR